VPIAVEQLVTGSLATYHDIDENLAISQYSVSIAVPYSMLLFYFLEQEEE